MDCQPTYEELKRPRKTKDRWADTYCQPTYEELKQYYNLMPYVNNFTIASLPMRN